MHKTVVKIADNRKVLLFGINVMGEYWFFWYIWTDRVITRKPILSDNMLKQIIDVDPENDFFYEFYLIREISIESFYNGMAVKNPIKYNPSIILDKLYRSALFIIKGGGGYKRTHIALTGDQEKLLLKFCAEEITKLNKK